MKQPYSISGLVAVISLAFSVIWLSPASVAAAPTFVSLGQIATEKLRAPGAMDLDEAGNLYVADGRGGLVHKFSPYGDLLQSFNLQNTGRGLAVTPDGSRLYVSRETSVVIANGVNGDEIGALDSGEANSKEFGGVGAIDLDADGNIFVVDAGTMQIKSYDASGIYRKRFGGIGPDAGQFLQITGMAINPLDGQLVVVDSSSSNGRVQAFTINADLSLTGPVNGNLLTTNTAVFGSPAMESPRGITYDLLGRFYLLDFMAAEIRGKGPVSFKRPGYGNVANLVFDLSNSRLFVGCDTGRIEILGVDGGQNPVSVNHAPTAPTQQKPVAGSEVASANPTLVINNATDEDGDALSYHVIVSKDAEVVFQADVAAVAGDTTSVVVDVVLAENASFSWTVQASDGEESSAVSAAANFVVNAVEEAPETPELSAPMNGDAVDGLTELSWGASSDPDPNDDNISYLVEVALDEAFAQIVASELLPDTALALGTFSAYGDLVDGSPYFWRVAALDAEQKFSAPSAARQFVYDTTILTVTANMPDATVSFSGNHAYAGRAIGVAPLELRDLTLGAISVVVERVGFEPFVAQINLAGKENVELYAELVPAKAVGSLNASNKGINGRSGLSVASAAVPFLVDFDNDGDLDLLVGDGSGAITLFANMQLAGRNRLYFDNGVSLGLPIMPGAVPFVADWNNDGRKDLLVGQADGSVKLFANVGLEEAPAFAPGVDVQTVEGALAVGSSAAPAVVDYNADGAKDLLVGNASGQVLVFLNQSFDATPLLSVPFTAMQVDGAVVPFPVDWNADGQKELMLTANGAVTVYAKVDGEYQGLKELTSRGTNLVGAFPVDLHGSGKQLLVGQSDGELKYLSGVSGEFVASFSVALQDKVDELAELVADAAPELLTKVTLLNGLIEAGDFASTSLAASDLALGLAEGSAQTSALELAALCQ